MNTPNICPKCAASLGPDSPEGLCAACLVAAALAPGDRIEYFGNYELIEEVGAGGMGLVWKARQVSLNRIVALKMIRSGTLANDEEVRRFLGEAEAAGQLQHPGIVAIHEIGTHEGQHYFTMDFIAGHHIGDVVDGKPLEPGRAARYARQIAEAVHHAHSHGILHRDLKPHNVMLDERDQPRVTDFGLAKRVGVESGITLTGANLGSPSYMSPEQARGENARVGVAADVYSLGAILYEMLTGRPPFQAASAMDTMRQVIDAEPAAPRRVNPAVPRDLETICLRCLEKEPGRRYATAQALADECGRFLDGEPIHARPVGVLARGVKWARRRPLVAGLAGAVAMLLLVLAIVIPGAALRIAKENKAAAQARVAALAALREAEQHREESRDHLARSLFEEARMLRTSDTPGRGGKAIGAIQKAALLLAEPRKVLTSTAESVIPRVDLRSEALAALLLAEASVVHETRVSTFPTGVKLDPNGRIGTGVWAENFDYQRIAAGDTRGLRVGLTFFDLTTGSKIMNLEGMHLIQSRPAISADGALAAIPTVLGEVSIKSMPSKAEIVLYDLKTKQPVKKLPWPEGVELNPSLLDVIFSADSQWIATSSQGLGSNIVLWDVAKGTGRKFAECTRDAPGFAAFTPDGKYLIFPLEEKKLAVREIETGTQKVLDLPNRIFGPAAVAPSGSMLSLPVRSGGASGMVGKDGARVVLDWRSGEQLFNIPLEYPDLLGNAAFSRDGRLAFSDGPDIKIFDLSTGRLTLRMRGNPVGSFQVVCWDEDDRFLTTAGMDGTVTRWRLSDAPPAHALRDQHSPDAPFAYSPDGRWFAFVHKGSIQLRDRRAPHPRRKLTPPSPEVPYGQPINDIAFKADGSQIAVVSNGRISIFETATGALLPADDKAGRAGNIAFNAEGHLIATRKPGVALSVEDFTTGRELWHSGDKGANGLGQQGRVSTDGRYVLNSPAFGKADPARLIDLATGTVKAQLHTNGYPAPTAYFKGDSLIALTALRMGTPSFSDGSGKTPRTGASVRTEDYGVNVFDTATGKLLAEYPGTLVGLHSEDGRLLALSCGDGKVEIRNAADGALLLRWAATTQPIRFMAFAPDGGTLTISDTQNPLQTLDITALRKSLHDLKLDW